MGGCVATADVEAELRNLEALIGRCSGAREVNPTIECGGSRHAAKFDGSLTLQRAEDLNKTPRFASESPVVDKPAFCGLEGDFGTHDVAARLELDRIRDFLQRTAVAVQTNESSQ